MTYFKSPVLIMFTSIPGSGKTFFARQAAEKMKAVCLSSDALRPAMYGSIEKWREAESRIAKEALLQQLFGAMDYASAQILKAGYDLIYDTNTNRLEYRNATVALAQKFGAQPVIVHLEVPRELALTRGQTRMEQDDQRRHPKDSMDALITRIQSNTDPFESNEPVVNLDGRASFDKQFESFRIQTEALVYGK